MKASEVLIFEESIQIKFTLSGEDFAFFELKTILEIHDPPNLSWE